MKIAELREALESVTAEQKYLKAREARHRRSKGLIFYFLTCCSVVWKRIMLEYIAYLVVFSSY